MPNKTSTNEELLSLLKRQQLTVEQYINMNARDNVDYDNNFETISRKNISERDEAYTDLLKHFVTITKIRNKAKEIHKWVYFWLIMIFMMSFIRFTFLLINKVDFSNTNDISNLVMVITTIVSFASVMISVPLIITKYLFSSKEDKRIAKIILHTQKHDIDGKKFLKNVNVTSKIENITDEEETVKNKELADVLVNSIRAKK